MDLLLLICILNAIFIIGSIFAERSNPQMVVLWIILMTVFPIGGFVIYLLFGQTFYSRYAFRKKKDKDANPKFNLNDNDAISLLPTGISMAKALENSSASPCLSGNNVKYISESELFFDELFESIHNAKKSLFLEYYIVRKDNIGQELLKALIKKAKEGVDVKLLVDDVGTRGIPSKLKKELRAVGGKVFTFHMTITLLLSPKKNNRNHRKIAVIDGQKAIISGYNIGDEYLGKGPFGHWRDAAVVIEGPIVDYYTRVFLQDWRYACLEDLVNESSLYSAGVSENNVPVQETHGGPDMPGINSIHMQYLSIVSASNKQIYITTPYLWPSSAIVYQLRLKALAGADVKIIMPDVGDHPFVYWGNRYSASKLMDAGIKVYEYHGGFIHAKTMVGDGYYCSVGSANLDPRSMNLNFECNAMIYDSNFGKDMVEAFDRDLENCTEYTMEMYRRRTLIQRFKTFLSRCFAELL